MSRWETFTYLQPCWDCFEILNAKDNLPSSFAYSYSLPLSLLPLSNSIQHSSNDATEGFVLAGRKDVSWDVLVDGGNSNEMKLIVWILWFKAKLVWFNDMGWKHFQNFKVAIIHSMLQFTPLPKIDVLEW